MKPRVAKHIHAIASVWSIFVSLQTSAAAHPRIHCFPGFKASVKKTQFRVIKIKQIGIIPIELCTVFCYTSFAMLSEEYTWMSAHLILSCIGQRRLVYGLVYRALYVTTSNISPSTTRLITDGPFKHCFGQYFQRNTLRWLLTLCFPVLVRAGLYTV